MWSLIDHKNHDYGQQILEWVGLHLDVIRATSSTEQDLVSRRDSAHRKCVDTKKSLEDDYAKLLDYIQENDVVGLFKE